jgi:hypothetical protein
MRMVICLIYICEAHCAVVIVSCIERINLNRFHSGRHFHERHYKITFMPAKVRLRRYLRSETIGKHPLPTDR